MNLTTLGPSYKWGQAVFVLLCLAYSTQHPALKVSTGQASLVLHKDRGQQNIYIHLAEGSCTQGSFGILKTDLELQKPINQTQRNYTHIAFLLVSNSVISFPKLVWILSLSWKRSVLPCLCVCSGSLSVTRLGLCFLTHVPYACPFLKVRSGRYLYVFFWFFLPGGKGWPFRFWLRQWQDLPCHHQCWGQHSLKFSCCFPVLLAED